MYLLPPQAIHDSQVRVSGDVTIHPTAAIAPGVLLYAEAGCRIEIEAGASIGMGTVLQAHGGQIKIQEGASLGAGVLIIGNAVIGSNAVVGPASTLFDHSVPAQALVPPGSLLGDRSRQPTPITPTSPISPNGSTSVIPPTPTEEPIVSTYVDPTISTYVDQGLPSHQTLSHQTLNTIPTNTIPTNTIPTSLETKPEGKSFVHGQSYVNDLLSTLLPHRNSLNSFPSKD